MLSGAVLLLAFCAFMVWTGQTAPSLMLYFYLSKGLPNGLFHSSYPVNNFDAFLVSPMYILHVLPSSFTFI